MEKVTLIGPTESELVLLERIEELEKALKDILSTVSLDWYVQQFGRDTMPSLSNSGIVAKIHNEETLNRIKGSFERARRTLAQQAGGKDE